jgi:hypothetical protein
MSFPQNVLLGLASILKQKGFNALDDAVGSGADMPAVLIN